MKLWYEQSHNDKITLKSNRILYDITTTNWMKNMTKSNAFFTYDVKIILIKKTLNLRQDIIWFASQITLQM